MASSDQIVLVNKAQPMGVSSPPAYAVHAPAPVMTSIAVTSQPAPPTQVTVVNTGPPVVHIQARPNNYMCLSVFACLCCNLLLGFIAILFSAFSTSAADDGDLPRARKHGRVAYWLSMSSVLLNVLGAILFTVLWFTVVVKAEQEASVELSVTCGGEICAWNENCCTSYLNGESACC